MYSDSIINGKKYSAETVIAMAADMPGDIPAYMAEVFRFLSQWYDERDYILQQTSGSTGEPKEIRLKKKYMWNSAKSTNTFFSLHKGDCLLLALPVSTIAGKMMLVRAIAGAMNIMAISPSGQLQIPYISIAFAAFVPMQMEQLLDKGLWTGKIQTVILGGTPVSTSLQEKLQKTQSRVYATYGMTETCSHVAVQRLNGSSPDSGFRVFPGIAVSLNPEGCIIIDAPGILSDPITTTDLGAIAENGMLKVTGRKDFIINSGGVKINPFFWEEYIQKQIRQQVLVIPVPDDRLGQRAVVVVESSACEVLTERVKRIIREIRKTTPVYKDPVFISKFPVNSAYKTDRKALIKQFQ